MCISVDKRATKRFKESKRRSIYGYKTIKTIRSLPEFQYEENRNYFWKDLLDFNITEGRIYKFKSRHNYTPMIHAFLSLEDAKEWSFHRAWNPHGIIKVKIQTKDIEAVGFQEALDRKFTVVASRIKTLKILRS